MRRNRFSLSFTRITSKSPVQLKEPKGRPKWLRVSRVLGECGITRDSAAGRRQFEQRMESRRASDESEFQALKARYATRNTQHATRNTQHTCCVLRVACSRSGGIVAE